MPGPLDALRKASTIEEGPSSWQETAQHGFEGAMEGLRGIASQIIPFVDIPESTAGHAGALLGAGVPLVGGAKKAAVIGKGLEGPHPAIRALMDTLFSEPSAVDIPATIGQSKVGGYYIPHRTPINVPEGFEIPEGGPSGWAPRDPLLVDKYVGQREAFDTTMAQRGAYGYKGSSSKVKPAPRANLNDLPPDFSSKFSYRDAKKD